MDPRVAAITARCVRYQKEEFLHDIRYSAGYSGEPHPVVEWMQMAHDLRLNLIELGATPVELWWIAWELGLQEEWYHSLQDLESWTDPRVGTPFEV